MKTFKSYFRKNKPNRPFDACRIYGELVLNKVAGNFHISAGKSLQLPRGHIHISAFIPEKEYNFSHRINHFSFGPFGQGIVHPLEGDEKIAAHGLYFIKIKTLTNQPTHWRYRVR